VDKSAGINNWSLVSKCVERHDRSLTFRLRIAGFLRQGTQLREVKLHEAQSALTLLEKSRAPLNTWE